MRKILLFMVALACAFVYLQRLDPQHSTKSLTASDVFAVDGDTLGHGDDRYRLIGFDTPETFRAQCDAEKALGLRAKARLVELIRSTGHVELEIEPDLDRYGRFLAVARVNGHEVGPVLILEGLARPYRGGKRPSWCS